MAVCPHCGQAADSGRTRLVQDSCGHKKCRQCLLSEESGCLSCQQASRDEPNGPGGILATSYTPVYTELQPAFGLTADNILPNCSEFQHVSNIPNENCSRYLENVEISAQVTENVVNNNERCEDYSHLEVADESETAILDSSCRDVENDDDEEEETEEDEAEKKRHSVVLKTHIVITPGDPPVYHCTVCKKSYKNRGAARYHNYCGSSNAEKPHVCDICGKGFITRGHFSYHMNSHTGTLPFPCDVCGKGFKQASKLKRHKRSHEGYRPFKCEVCSRSFCAKHVLNDHMMSHGGMRPFSCSVCGKKLSSKSCLRKHKLLHSVPAHKCDDCGKSFSVKWNLEIHRKTHMRDRKFKCKQCGRAFKLGSDLKRHAVVHQEDGAWDCKVCNLTFGRKDNLVRHMKNIHPEFQQKGAHHRKTTNLELPSHGDKASSEGNKNETSTLDMCTATPPAPAPQAVSVIRSWAVPVIKKMDRNDFAISELKSTDTMKNYMPTITKAVLVSGQDECSALNAHSVSTPPLEVEMHDEATSRTLQHGADGLQWQHGPVHLPASSNHYYSTPESRILPGEQNQCSEAVQKLNFLSREQTVQRESVVRHSDARVILHYGSSTHGSVPVTHLEDVSNPRTRKVLPNCTNFSNRRVSVNNDEETVLQSSSGCRPRVIVEKQNHCDIEGDE